MLSLTVIALFAFAAVLAIGVVVTQVMGALPKFAELHNAAQAAPALRQVSYTISEVVVSRDGKVVALPVKPVRLVRSGPLRAAA